MPKISTYEIVNPKDADTILISQAFGDTQKLTRNISIGELKTYIGSGGGASLPYTSLVQLLNQTGTAAPVATEVYNNTGQTFTWSYVSQGVYRITSTGAPFAGNKTVVLLNPGAPGAAAATIQWNLINSSTIELTSLNLNATTNGLITNGSFEVKIYN